MALILLAVSSGIAAGTSLLVPGLWLLSILGCSLFAYTLYSLPKHAYLHAFVIGSCFGVAYSGVALAWWWSTIPLDWLGITSVPQTILFLVSYWGSVSLVFGVFFGAFAAVFARLNTGSMVDAVLAASLWTLLQYLQMWGFAILTFGDGSIFGAHFSPTMLGYALAAYSPLLQLASLGGVYLLTFIAVWLGFAAYHACMRARTSRPVAGGLMVLILLIVASGMADRAYFLADTFRVETGPSVSVGLVNTWDAADAPDTKEETEAAQGTIRTLVRDWTASHGSPDIIVLPESIALISDRTDLDDIRLLSGPSSLMDPGTAPGEKRIKRIYFYDAGAIAGVYDKIFLVPQGEYLPWLYGKMLSLFAGDEFKAHMQDNLRFFERGDTDKVRPVTLKGVKVGALMCNDMLSPQLYRGLTENGAAVLINMSSHSWFHRSELVDDVVLAIAKVRAVETGRYLAIAGNEVPSSVISDQGRVLARTEIGNDTVLARDVPLKEHRTLYVRFGVFVLILPLIALAVFLRRTV